MARAHSIYFFQSRLDGRILAAFTVKYEALSWVKRHGYSPDDVTLYRLPDGRGGQPAMTKEFNRPEMPWETHPDPALRPFIKEIVANDGSQS